MAKRPPRAPNPNSKSRPIAFRLDRTMITRLDDVAKKLGKPRNALVALILREYLIERGEVAVERMVKEDAGSKAVNLFA